ncbi:MAG: alpha-glucosidase/alpha-galactosidase, partial [Thermotogota bacterium]|nr:alpha-glucosidase/alpha-galactosidase [Thermotogota bacterium]
IPFIDAIANNNSTRLVVNTLNKKSNDSSEVVIQGISNDIACEFPAIVDSQGIHPEEINPKLTDRIVKWYLMPRILRMEWALEAFIKKDKSLIVEFLMRDRRTTSYEQAKAVVEEIFENNA